MAVNNAGNLGNSSSILIGDTTGTATPASTTTIPTTPLVPCSYPRTSMSKAGSSGVAFIAGQTANTYTTTYTGSIQVDKTTNIYSGFWGGIAVTGPISGVGGLNLFTSNRGSGETLRQHGRDLPGQCQHRFGRNTTFQNNQSPGSNFAIHWDYKPATNAAVNTSFGQGTITMQNNQGFDFFVTAGSSAGTNTATMTNPSTCFPTRRRPLRRNRESRIGGRFQRPRSALPANSRSASTRATALRRRADQLRRPGHAGPLGDRACPVSC